MKNILTVLAVTVAGALPVAATAAEPSKPAIATNPAPTPPQGVSPEAGRTELPPMFRELDTDKDGQVSKDESKRSAEIQASFDAMDTDRSGKISLIEWSAADKAKPRPKP